ncbi:MAG: hypothetical protein E7487_01020 [Ruminococcaceae bacterium]|nr:hypothetical protein [Oscillospiraceae bacterium]
MIKLIVGTKGSGKTKALINLINEAAKTTKGNVVCIEKGLKLTYDLDYSVRLVDIEQFAVSGFDSFYGFIAGVLAGNYDITHVFIDATFKIGGRDIPAFENMILKLEKLLTTHGAEITFTVSCDPSEIPEDIKKYMI